MNLKKLNIENKKIRDFIPQALTILARLSVVIYFATNAQINMGNRGISFGFGFLNQEASFDITFSLIDYDGSYSCLLYTSPSPRDLAVSRMPSSA